MQTTLLRSFAAKGSGEIKTLWSQRCHNLLMSWSGAGEKERNPEWPPNFGYEIVIHWVRNTAEVGGGN